MKYPLILVFSSLVMSACGGGGGNTDATGVDALNGLTALEFEDYTMRGVDAQVDYVGTIEALNSLDNEAALYNFSAAELNEIPMDSLCRYRIYTSQGAILDWFFEVTNIHFTEGGRLSGGFNTGHTIYSINNQFYYDMGVRIPDENGVDVILTTPEQYGQNIVANVTKMGLNETVTRILQLAPCSN